MVQSNTPLKSDVRLTDPNVLQQRASHPQTSVWVGASAGSGKTKVLTDRILRLLLPTAKGIAGTPPQKIMALTFTKAGASEMSIRINKRLSEWAVIDDETLVDELKNLLGMPATLQQIETARKLFAVVVDTPGGLKIMTIHSFCQSVLSRFPLEADLPPSFKALEEAQAQIFLENARDYVLKETETEKGSPLSSALQNIAMVQNEDQFMDLLKNIMSERRQFRHILDQNFGVDGLYTALCNHFNIPAGQSHDDIIFDAVHTDQFDETGLKEVAAVLSTGTPKTDQPKAIKIVAWLKATPKERMALFEEYKKIFLTTENEIRANIATKKLKNNNPNINPILEQEALRLINIVHHLKSANSAALTRDLFLIGNEILTHYEAAKNNESALDFDDLILRTLDLLQGRTNNMKGLNPAPWVRFKLDQGIDHILVDEAQDTNPEQWEIVKALCDDFFDGSIDNDIERTIFVVGDEKQSIFSFQRASPEKFQEMRKYFSEKISNSNNNFSAVDFNVSFRSVKSVLHLVDRVFDDPDIRKGLSVEPLMHEAFRYTQAGLVELWPLFENPEKEDFDPWAPPTEIINSTSGASQMADHIGESIAGWIDNKETLESHNRPIEAGDIMILVRSRTAFIDQLVRALKTRNIPVSGVDRMVLSDQLVVQDLSAAASFALLPDDDLTLAALLKSPFIGWDEDQLFNVAHNREGSLWQSVKKSKDTKTISWLENLITHTSKQRPYEFFATLLQQQCPQDNLSGLRAIKKRLGEECLDPLDEFLNVALNFEVENIPSLQLFLQQQSQNESQIKRQMEEGSRAVRIMTVHGAKGLQAPIVILPDTVRSANSNKSERILWPDRSGEKLPFFFAQSKEMPAQCKDATALMKQRQDEEYRRLFYVAMTRAENRLYIGGYKASKNPIDESWYRYAERTFENMDDVETIKYQNSEKNILRYTNPATDKPDRAQNEQENNAKDHEITQAPAWLFKAMPSEPTPARPLTPSRPSQPDMPALSPLKSNAQDRFLRGNITHKLLQILPDLSADKRQRAAEKYVAQPAHNLSQRIQDSIVAEALGILNHPDFKKIFGENSIAEAPISGMLDNNRLISGQIDRLLVTETEIFIIDFKTNRPPPQHEKDVPQIYREQMKAYADTMRQIYPQRHIRAALIWTDGARLMELTDI